MYDYIFVTHLPAFYKSNLYNKLSEKMRVFVIFIGETSNIRTNDFVKSDKYFEYMFLNSGDFETRNLLKSVYKLLKSLKILEYKYLVVGGWDLIEFWVGVFVSPRKKNAIVVESTLLESKLDGFRKLLKKLFVSRITIAFPSGKLHEDLLVKLNFQGRSYITKGVGIFPKKPNIRKKNVFQNKFLYVGRLAEEKNVRVILEFFNLMPDKRLTIVGAGPLKEELVANAKSNISFLNHVPNDKIDEVYNNHDILVLISKSEPWGLVVEEALYYRLPVILSSNIGCAIELIGDGKSGIIIKDLNFDSFREATELISLNYKEYLKNLDGFDSNDRDSIQVNTYLRALQ